MADRADEHGRVRIARLGPTGLVVTRTIEVPAPVATLAWIAAEPVVQLDNGAVGRIGATGYVAYPTVPAAQWEIPRPAAPDPDEPTERFEAPHWRVLIAPDGAVWQARCDWGWDLPHGIAHHCVPEGGYCHAWVYARIAPAPLAIAREAPTAAFDSSGEPHQAAIPTIAASSAVRAEIVSVPLEDGPQRDVLRCTEGDTSIQYPTDDDRDLRAGADSVADLTWLATLPPMFSVSRRAGCLDTETVVFEGCTPSERYGGAHSSGGPNDLLVIHTSDDRLVLRWHDREVGALDGVALFAWAPER